ncbi:hypothetical protein EPN28_01585 [Patescibacteria group bacterium]|nr:MAG: hypothetical protein EPN28_01585 [Patescibacteria group bacterium]
MFDDQKAASAPPANLPGEPVDIFDGVEKKANADYHPASPPETSSGQALIKGGTTTTASAPTADALSAGLLKKKPLMEDSGREMNLRVQTPPVGFEDLSSEIPAYKMKAPIVGKVVLAIALVIVLLGGGWWAYGKFIKQPAAKPASLTPAGSIVPDLVGAVEPNASTSAPQPPPAGDYGASVGTAADSGAAPPPTSTEVPNKMKNDTILFGEAVDTDKDGLDDVREKELGTDPEKTDSDSDGLTDGDEVIIWKTDPLNPDTDGDSYVDGKEVRNGYNPLGPGKLFAPQPATNTVAN